MTIIILEQRIKTVNFEWKRYRYNIFGTSFFSFEYSFLYSYQAQAGIKISGRNIDNLRYTDDTTLMAESEEELKSLLMKMKEESETLGLKPNIQETKIMASGPITSWRINGETMETVRDYFGGLQNHCRW